MALLVKARSSRLWFRNLTLLCASSLTVMAGTPIAPALPTMAAAFEGQPHADLLLGLMLTMPSLCIGVLALASGWLVDRFGRKPLLLWGAVLYTVAGSSGLYLDSLWTILIGRALLGVAVAAVMTAAVTLIGDYFTGPSRHRFMGIQAASMSLGGVVFLLAGGMLADWHWRGPFAVYFAAIAVVPMVLLSIREPMRSRVVVPHSGEPTTMPAPRRVLALIYATAFFGMLAFYAIPVQLPFHLQALTDADGTYVGIAIACMTSFSTLSAMLYSRLKARLSFHGVIAVMWMGIGLGFLIVAMATGYGVILLGMMVAGLGLGLLMPNLNVWLMHAAPPSMRGRLVGGLTAALFLGQFVSPIVLRPVLTAWGTAGLFQFLGLCMLALMVGFGGYAWSRASTPRTDDAVDHPAARERP